MLILPIIIISYTMPPMNTAKREDIIKVVHRDEVNKPNCLVLLTIKQWFISFCSTGAGLYLSLIHI